MEDIKKLEKIIYDQEQEVKRLWGERNKLMQEVGRLQELVKEYEDNKLSAIEYIKEEKLDIHANEDMCDYADCFREIIKLLGVATK